MAKNSKAVQQKADEKRKGQRTRNWTVIAYPDDLPDTWQDMLDDKCVKWICSPLHDKDLNADGQPKKPHYHLLFMFDVVKTKEQVKAIFGELYGWSDDSVIGIATPQTVSDRCALVRYMAHLDNPSKAQYDVSAIVGHCGADPLELLKHSASEMREIVVAMEEYIDDNNITELVDFAKAIRYDHQDWHDVLCTKMTVYFNAYIRSNRHRLQPPACDPVTGEVM